MGSATERLLAMSREPVTIEEFSGSAAEWDAFVRAQHGWTHFHLFGWKRAIERIFDHECPYLAARGVDGRLEAILPLVRVDGLVFGRYLVSMPFVNYGGPLGAPDAIRRLTSFATELARRERRVLQLRCRSRTATDLPWTHRKVTVLLDLPQDIDALWKSFNPKVRNQVRRPQKEGATVRFGLDEIDAFFRVFSRNMRDLGTPTQSRRFFETISEIFPRDIRFGSVFMKGRPVAVGCGLCWNGEFEMTWASSLRTHNRFAPNMLLYWSFMRQLVEDRVLVFNHGRCTPGSGTHKFKLQWGGREEPLWWYYRADAPRTSTPSPDDSKLAWAPSLWRHLPLRLANAVGPRVVRYLP